MELRFDFHLHSCLSPCGDMRMTPATVAGMCALAGLDVAALTDHNSCGNCAAFCAAAEAYGLLALPGMELCTAEEIHVICLLPDLDRAAAFSREVRENLPNIPNAPEIFGPQVLMDKEDRILGEEPLLLSGASFFSIVDLPALMERYDGVAWPAHIDRPSYSILSNLGLWDPTLGFPLAEISRCCPPDFFQRRDLLGIPMITGCDAHSLEQIPDQFSSMEVSERSRSAVLTWLRGGGPGIRF